MIAEAFVYLTSLAAAPPGFRRHLPEAIGLWARGTRQANAWAPHISNARGLVDTAIDEIDPRRRVAVLGSGPLFDLPLESLARTFERVDLIDRAHLSTTRSRIARYANITREWRDLGGVAAPLSFLAEAGDLDWVISLNLLSQLAAHAPAGEERAVIDAHLDGLASLPCRTTLITDLDYRVTDNAGTVIESADLLHGRPMPPPDLTWKWEVVPFGEESPDTRRVHAVAAWLDWGHAVRQAAEAAG